MLKKVLIWTVAVLVLAFGGIQLVPVDRSNPEPRAPLVADAAVMETLQRSCYDCHSSETTWPWYSYVAPVSWLVAKDVREGRRHINFSNWGEFSAGDMAHAAEEILEEVEDGAMPLPIYLRMHPEAELSTEDIDVLVQWAGAIEQGGEIHGRHRGGHDDEEDDDD